MAEAEKMLEDAMTRKELLERIATELVEIRALEDQKKKTADVANGKIKTRESIIDQILKRLEDDANGIQRLPFV